MMTYAARKSIKTLTTLTAVLIFNLSAFAYCTPQEVVSFTPNPIAPGAHVTDLVYRYAFLGPAVPFDYYFDKTVELYLSRNTIFGDSDDIQIGEHISRTDVPAGVSIYVDTVTLSGNLPFLIPAEASGLYYLVLRMKQTGTVNGFVAAQWRVEVKTDIPNGIPPTIVKQPVGARVDAGATVVFGVEANGDAPLSYQWRRNGENIIEGNVFTGASSAVLQINGVRVNDAGEYSVLVRNSFGSITSEPAILSVRTPVLRPLSLKLERQASRGILVTAGGEPGIRVIVEVSTNLIQWTQLKSNDIVLPPILLDAGGTAQIVDSLDAMPSRLYRARDASDDTAGSALGNDLTGRNLQLTYSFGGGELFTFTSETAGIYERNSSDRFTYQYTAATGELKISRPAEQLSMRLNFNPGSSSDGTTTLFAVGPSGIQESFPATFTLRPASAN